MPNYKKHFKLFLYFKSFDKRTELQNKIKEIIIIE